MSFPFPTHFRHFLAVLRFDYSTFFPAQTSIGMTRKKRPYRIRRSKRFFFVFLSVSYSPDTFLLNCSSPDGNELSGKYIISVSSHCRCCLEILSSDLQTFQSILTVSVHLPWYFRSFEHMALSAQIPFLSYADEVPDVFPESYAFQSR